ncbi:NAD(P)-dependent oxidoreductase [uncultured Methanobrevibacter sp.]|uniref:NAD-dependent epimerase/dehydratase family protein n=1 Tax=uncultured Methanobrevibacter sp. TaxID=253161 RepID=UPI0025CEC111|nr:NAD-dependent epimerase/dehydratase family protein [uncultured Methanobrevibacter sp.]
MSKISFKNKKVLVTGGSGVIGRELLRYLMDEEADVLSVDRLPLPEGNWDSIKHVQKDLATDDLSELIDFDPEVILHLAAAFERSEESPEFWDVNWHDNMLVSHNVVNLTKDMSNLNTFVFASSYLLYDTQLYMSNSLKDVKYLKETDVVYPRNLCGGAKFYTEKELEFIKELFLPDLRVVNARIYRVYGRGSNCIISRWVRMCLNNETLQLYNKDNQFDYVFAGDVAKGLLELAQSDKAEGIVNLATGTPNKVNNIILNLIEDGVLDKGNIVDNGVTEDFEASCADISKLKDVTGWQPKTDLKLGIKKIIAYEKDGKLI